MGLVMLNLHQEGHYMEDDLVNHRLGMFIKILHKLSESRWMLKREIVTHSTINLISTYFEFA